MISLQIKQLGQLLTNTHASSLDPLRRWSSINFQLS